jgi:phosphinothricin acetyltransferase
VSSHESLIVRHADPARDAEACAAIYAPYVLDGATSFEEEAPDADAMTQRIAENSATHPWLVAEAPQGIVGYAYASAHRSRAAYRWAVDVAVYVHAAHRRDGLGRRLYDELLPRLRRQGFAVACAAIVLPNAASVGLHEAVGFEPAGVFSRIGYKAGGWREVGWWQLRLIAPNGPPAEPRPPTDD